MAASIHGRPWRPHPTDTVAVESAGRTVVTDSEPPFEFVVRESELVSVTGQRQFQVVLEDPDGNTIRRSTRTVSMVSER